MPMMLELGVRYIGSCCGSTPEHTRAIARKVEASLEDLKVLEPSQPASFPVLPLQNHLPREGLLRLA